MKNQTTANLRNLLAWVKGPGSVNPNLRLVSERNDKRVFVALQLYFDNIAPSGVTGEIMHVEYEFTSAFPTESWNGYTNLELTYKCLTLNGKVTDYIRFMAGFNQGLTGSVQQVLEQAIEIVERDEPKRTQVAYMRPRATEPPLGGVPLAIEDADMKYYNTTMPQTIKSHAPKLYRLYKSMLNKSLLAQHRFDSVAKNMLSSTIGVAPKEQWPLYQDAFADLAAKTPAFEIDDSHKVVLADGQSKPGNCGTYEDIITDEPFRMGELVVTTPTGDCTFMETHIKHLAQGNDHDPFGVPYGEGWGLSPAMPRP